MPSPHFRQKQKTNLNYASIVLNFASTFAGVTDPFIQIPLGSITWAVNIASDVVNRNYPLLITDMIFGSATIIRGISRTRRALKEFEVANERLNTQYLNESDLESLTIKNLRSKKSKSLFFFSDQYPLQKKEQLKKRVTLSKYVLNTRFRNGPFDPLHIDIDRDSFGGGGLNPPNTKASLPSPIGFDENDSEPLTGGAEQTSIEQTSQRPEEDEREPLMSQRPQTNSNKLSCSCRRMKQDLVKGFQYTLTKFTTAFTNYGEEQDTFDVTTLNMNNLSQQNQSFLQGLNDLTTIETNLNKFNENVLVRNLNNLQKGTHNLYIGIQGIYQNEKSKQKSASDS